MEFIICTSEHLDAVIEMYSKVLKKLETTVNYPKWSEEHPSREYICESAANSELFACVENGEILGAAVLSENPEGSYERGDWKADLSRGEYLVVHTLAVSPEHERRGVGSFMVDGCIAFAKENGYKALRLDVLKENIPAINLYKSKGFTFAGTKDLLRNIEGIPFFDLYELNI